MAMLTRIKDPLRLKEGDLVILPADYSGRRRLKPHLSLNTLGKLGLSIGDTSRSTNRTSVVREWLSDKPDETRYFVITHASVAETDLTKRKYAAMMGNDRKTEEVPEVDAITFVRIAAPGEDANLDEAAAFLKTDWWRMTFEALSDTDAVTGDMVFCQYDKENGDYVLDDIFDQSGVKTPERPVPNSSVQRRGSKLHMQECSDSFDDILEDVDVPEITIPAKAISALAERGYVFARPDAAFAGILARSCAKALLTEAVGGWKERGVIFADFMKTVRLAASAVQTRLKAYDLASKRCWVKADERRRAAALAGKAIE